MSDSFSFKSFSKVLSNEEPTITPTPPAMGRRRGLVEPIKIVEDQVVETTTNKRKFNKPDEDDMTHIVQTGTMDSIRFSFFSSQEVFNFSAVELKEPKIEGANGVYDLRMGPSEDHELCETCGENREKCPGHFGHIALNVPIPHPLCSKSILNFLKCFCYKCHRLVLTEKEIFLKGFNKLKSTRFEAILKEIDKNVTRCGHPDCRKMIPTYSFDDDKYYKTFRNINKKEPMSYSEIVEIFSDICYEDINLIGLTDKRYAMFDLENSIDEPLVHPIRLIIENLPVLPPCARPYAISGNDKSHDDLTEIYKSIIATNNEFKKPEKLSETEKEKAINLLVLKIRILFDNSKKKMPKINIKKTLIGIKERISGKHGHIRKYLLGKRTDFSARTVIGGDNTIGVNEVIIPPQVASILSVPVEVTSHNIHYCQKLLDDGLVNNIHPKGKNFKLKSEKVTNTLPTYYHSDDLIVIPDEFGNEKRCDIYSFLNNKHPEWFDASGVIIAKDKVADAISNYQIIRREYVKVSSLDKSASINLDSDFYNENSKKKTTNDNLILEERLIPPRIKKQYKLHIGDKIDRQAKNGDWVVFNRQPTLWKGSMQAKQIKILPGKTFRFSLCTTQAFNADHDGDEMNISMCQRPDVISEVKELMSTNETFISSKDSKPMLTVKLDIMSGWYKLTYGLVPISKQLFNDTISRLPVEEMLQKIEHIRNVYSKSSIFNKYKTILSNEKPNLSEKEINDQTLDNLVYSGYGLFSMLCPNDFEYNCDNKMSPDKLPVSIKRGVMLSGTFNKTALGSESGSLIHHIAKDYGNIFASQFMMNMQCFINDTLQFLGFSCGMEDFIPANKTTIVKVMYDSYVKAYASMVNEQDLSIRELKVSSALSEAVNQGQQFAQKSLEIDNNLVVMVNSGSKGNPSNISQITSIIGQQFVGSNRIPKLFGGRSLSSFPRTSYRSTDPDILPQDNTLDDAMRIFESRGFIESSFFDGLKPHEYFLLAAGGRQGLIDTAVTTADTGYVQRKISKILEDIQISYAGTVNTPSHNIIQFAYGGDNMDPARLIKCSPKKDTTIYSFIDIKHTVDKLNTLYEK
jgi:DNA-directed RNA polymerase beta' subunit